MPPVVLEVRNLKTHFFTRWGVVKAVDGVSFSLSEGETLGLVGESGSGKSVTCLSILRLVPKPAGRIVGGQILFGGHDLLALSEKEMRKYRGRQISMILQDPLSTLNPVFTIGAQVREPLRIHHLVEPDSLKQRVLELLRLVRIPAAESRLENYPHQFSGGMRQRVVGAIAIACQPKLLIADEPTTSLDVTIQAQYLRLLKEIQRQSNLALLFVTHDFGIVAKMCDRVAVMYAGRIVEEAAVRELFTAPAHPYTQGLLQSLPKLDQRVARLPSIEGAPPLLSNLPPGCPFAPRCPKVMPLCREQYPPTTPLTASHQVACWVHAKEGHATSHAPG
ncbi:MAG: ABC transporter ATP-binding protein [Deltaproteobacteria bacterium]|nr:ABC transporter ATP-binding protein [Deltaproteobacteria bacterium]